jgi:polyisoprenoid-binding protein YceI
MKTKLLTLSATAIVGTVALVMTTVSCNKDDSFTPVDNTVQYGSDKIDIRPGGDWSIDKVHSNVMWETEYYGDNALLTGRFNNFDMDVYFDEAAPENSTIEAWVQLSTFNAGEPGRDAYSVTKVGCGMTYMGVEFDVDTTANTITPVASSDTAWFKSTSVARKGSGYVAEGELTFRGVTKPVEMNFTYAGQHEYTSSTGAVSVRSGLAGEFSMNAISDFGIVSTSIADKVVIRVDCNMKKN